MIKVVPMSSPVVERSITVDADMSWYVHCRGRIMTRHSTKLLCSFPAHVQGKARLLEIVCHVPPCVLEILNPSLRMSLRSVVGHCVALVDR